MVPTIPQDPAALRGSSRYELGTQANRLFQAGQALGLLRFGRGVMTPGGGASWLDDHGRPDPSHGVQTWITCRMAHVYSLGTMLGFPGAERIVDNMVQGLLGRLHGDENGGWYPSLTLRPDGTVDHGTVKECYAHAFVMLAASSAWLAGRPGAEELLEKAVDTYDTYFWDEQAGLAVDTLDTPLRTVDPYRGINANMHSTEAFLAIADATGDERFRRRAGRVITHVVDWARANNWRIPEHFDQDWNPRLDYNADRKDDQFKPYGATPGHGIEWSRLITQWAISTYGWDPATTPWRRRRARSSTRRSTCSPAPWPTAGRQTASPGSSIRPTGRADPSFMTGCTGPSPRASTPPPRSTR